MLDNRKPRIKKIRTPLREPGSIVCSIRCGLLLITQLLVSQPQLLEQPQPSLRYDELSS